MARMTKQQIADNEAAAAALHAEQQAELARLRKEKRAKNAADRQARNALAPSLEEISKPGFNEAKPFDPAAEDAARFAKIEAAWHTLMEGFEVPSWKRAVTGIVLALIAAAGTGYMAGIAIGILITAAVSLTGMAWVGWCILLLGAIAGGWLGGRVASVVYGYIADKKIDTQFDAIKAKATSWFRKPVITEFSGAHEAAV